MVEIPRKKKPIRKPLSRLEKLSNREAVDQKFPKPLLLEPDNNVIGRSFLLFEHCPGRTQGSWFGFTEPSRSVVADLAACLAKLHSISPAALGFSEEMEMSTEAIMAREIKFRWEKWCRDAVEASPIIEYAFAWLEKECRHGLGVPAVIHGDAGPHNLLIDDGRISAILDWELVHVGDPAEDLAYARTAIEAQIPWNEFLDIYYQNGGRPVDERRLKIFSIYGLVRNASFSATAAASFTKGESDDFMLGAVGIVPIPKIETLLIHLLIN
jgi:aminoglycoside phosphotransferase (APT) family kinase protein